MLNRLTLATILVSSAAMAQSDTVAIVLFGQAQTLGSIATMAIECNLISQQEKDTIRSRVAADASHFVRYGEAFVRNLSAAFEDGGREATYQHGRDPAACTHVSPARLGWLGAIAAGRRPAIAGQAGR